MSQPSWLRAVLLLGLFIVVVILVFGVMGHARSQAALQTDKPFVIEYYYKTKWATRTSSLHCSRRITTRC
jgi:hypothetical protein